MHCKCLNCGRQNAIAGMAASGKQKEGQAPISPDFVNCGWCGKPIPESEFQYGAIPMVHLPPAKSIEVLASDLPPLVDPSLIEQLKELIPDEITIADSHVESIIICATAAKNRRNDFLRLLPTEILVIAHEAQRYRRLQKLLPLLWRTTTVGRPTP